MILGIDPGTTGMGFALLDPSSDPAVVVDCGVVETPSLGTAAERLVAIADALDALIARHAPAAIAVERLYFNRNARTAMAVAEARGVALLCAGRARIAVAEYTPQEVKLSVTGDGTADKRAVQRMLAVILRLEVPVVQDNAADAIAVALTHAQRRRLDRAVARARA
ncbi:MAG TPA: crossover junction endodeoxyribonuclease RuvC [Candidatus Limnocylindrales bacterium]|nr:crossover junction endodeoxyribonuclease RuvC [Candidatus Limnocylindrales bacterium]